METVEKSNPDFSTVSTALGNPATDAGFPHFPSHDGGGYPLPLKANPAKIAGPVRILRRAQKCRLDYNSIRRFKGSID